MSLENIGLWWFESFGDLHWSLSLLMIYKNGSSIINILDSILQQLYIFVKLFLKIVYLLNNLKPNRGVLILKTEVCITTEHSSCKRKTSQ